MCGLLSEPEVSSVSVDDGMGRSSRRAAEGNPPRPPASGVDGVIPIGTRSNADRIDAILGSIPTTVLGFSRNGRGCGTGGEVAHLLLTPYPTIAGA
jgi:hypothetical protein